MFYIFISGLQGNQAKVEEFAIQVLNHYFGNRIKRIIDIEIRFVKHLKGTLGYCWGDPDHVIIEIAKQDGNGNKFTKAEMMETLAHELVHAKQHIRKDKRKPQLTEAEAYGIEEQLFKLYWN